jgi:hypothetical protein
VKIKFTRPDPAQNPTTLQTLPRDPPGGGGGDKEQEKKTSLNTAGSGSGGSGRFLCLFLLWGAVRPMVAPRGPEVPTDAVATKTSSHTAGVGRGAGHRLGSWTVMPRAGLRIAHGRGTSIYLELYK